MANQASIMDALPTGTVTFLFTDIEGSTQRWERDPNAMREALRRHDAIVRAGVTAHGGRVFKATGDGFCAAFRTADEAIGAAADAQRALDREDWARIGGLAIRVAVHTGTADERDGDYFGSALNRVSRLLQLARGGQILLSATTALLVRDALRDGDSLLFLGRYRLADLSEVEAVHQLLFAHEQTVFSPLVVSERPAHNLPALLTSYIEGNRTIDEVIDAVGQSRLITLTGAGGVGKTRTALEAAHLMIDDWRDGTWFVQLESTTDSDTVVRAVASTLSVRDVPRRRTLDTLLDYMAPRRLLLLLDNCEHVVEPVADFVQLVLQRCRDVNVLTTSREPLRIAGERLITIDPLSVPAYFADRLPSATELESSPAVKLFLDRARNVEPNFQLTDSNRIPVQQICQRLDGIPLALELTAARVGAFAPRILAERLENRFALLSRGPRGTIPHHRTLHALVDWSWSLLSEQERVLFRRLAVFAGGWTLEAAEVICSGQRLDRDAILQVLETLCSKSLVRSEVADTVRFNFLETIRAFALEKLDAASEREKLDRSHAAYHARLADELEPLLRSGAQHETITRITADVDNFRAVLDAVDRDPSLRDAGLAICAGIWRYWLLVGAFSEGRRFLEVHARGTTGDINRLIRTVCGLALLALGERNLEEFLLEARRAVRLSEGASDQWSVAFAAVCECMALSFMPQARSDLHDIQDLDRARRLAGSTGDPWLLTYVEFSEATRADQGGDQAAALAHEELSLQHARRSGDRFLLSTVGIFLANRLHQGEPTRAAHLLRESTNTLEPGSAVGLAACLECAVRIAVRLARYDAAATFMGAAARFRQIAAVPALRYDPSEHRAFVERVLGSDRFGVLQAAGKRFSFGEATAKIDEFVRSADRF